jgi:Protein of unknown function (DUF2829).
MKTFDFSRALFELKNGSPLTRTGWNGANQYVKMQEPDGRSKMQTPYLYLRTIHGNLVPWIPSQEDLFAEDWLIVTV